MSMQVLHKGDIEIVQNGLRMQEQPRQLLNPMYLISADPECMASLARLVLACIGSIDADQRRRESIRPPRPKQA